jgi:type VI secretion system protein ImpF
VFSLRARKVVKLQGTIIAVTYASNLPKEQHMHGFSAGLFDRLDDDDEQNRTNRIVDRSRPSEQCKRSVTRDLELLLNTRSALLPAALAPYPGVAGSVVNYGLVDFAGKCMSSHTDQQQICTAVRLAIERHEPRLHRVAVVLRQRKGAINRLEFIITAQLRSSPDAEPMSLNAVFRPSLQQYSIEGIH